MIAVIADLASTYTAVRNKFGGKLDYGKVLNYLAEKRTFKLYAYGIQDREEVPTFIDALNHLGFITFFQKNVNWTVQIVLDCFSLMDKVNHYVFITDNKELAPLIIMLWNRGYKITLFTTGDRCDWPCDNFIELNPLLLEAPIHNHLEIKKNETAKATE